MKKYSVVIQFIAEQNFIRPKKLLKEFTIETLNGIFMHRNPQAKLGFLNHRLPKIVRRDAFLVSILNITKAITFIIKTGTMARIIVLR